MDFGDSPEEAEFRSRLRDWLRDNDPGLPASSTDDAYWAGQAAWHQSLYEGGFFGTTLFRAYGGLLADLNNFPALDLPQLQRRALRAPAPVAHSVDVGDGVKIKLTRYAGGARGPVVLAPGFSVRASSFATDTVEQNLVEALCARGYDVWLFDYRASPDSGSPIAPFTIDDIARVDWPAAVRFILETTGAPDLQAIDRKSVV